MAMISRLNCTNLASQICTVGRKVLLTRPTQRNHPLPFQCCTRSIYSKSTKDPDHKRPAPFPYKERNFTFIHRLFDRTPDRMDENSKIIVVDGAIAAGKSAFAKELAEELDMLYIPEANMDMIYINPYGYDLRQLDPQLPESVRSFDTKNFCLNPNHPQVAFLQVMLYQLKFYLYIDALAHVLSTGQGVVLDKSVYSDFVYVEALVKQGFMGKTAKSVYYDIIRHTLEELMRPHLAIYLDVPVEKVLQKVKERGYPHEQNSKALNPEFLKALEDAYKRQYLKDVSVHSEVLIYDWSDGGDVEVVVEDIERLDFDKYTVYDDKMADWRLWNLRAWNDKRKIYADQKALLMTFFNVPRYDCPELIASGEDYEKHTLVMAAAPGMEYIEGYNPVQGDKNLWFKFRPKSKFSYFQ